MVASHFIERFAHEESQIEIRFPDPVYGSVRARDLWFIMLKNEMRDIVGGEKPSGCGFAFGCLIGAPA